MQKNRFLAIGECMIELSPIQGTQKVSQGFAGDTFNTAWYAARHFPSNWEVSYYTAIGEDRISKDFLDFAEASQLDMSNVVSRADRTLGLYMIHLDKGERSFTYWRDNSAARTLALSNDVLTNVMDQADVIYFSGITIAILEEPDRRNLLSALSAAHDKGKTVVFDPNLRPKLWADKDQMLQSTTVFAGCSNIVMPSFEDEQLYFGDVGTAETARRYSELGAELIAVKNGEKEIVIQHGSECYRFNPKQIANPVDTTAAGDSFNAGFLAAYLSGAQLDVAVRVGCNLAGEVIGNHGALIETPLLRSKYR